MILLRQFPKFSKKAEFSMLTLKTGKNGKFASITHLKEM